MKVVGAPQGTSQSQSDSCSMPRRRVIGLKVVISVHKEAATGCERKLPQSMQALPVSLPVSLHLTLCPCTSNEVHTSHISCLCPRGLPPPIQPSVYIHINAPQLCSCNPSMLGAPLANVHVARACIPYKYRHVHV
jgi:hypothetical protein